MQTPQWGIAQAAHQIQEVSEAPQAFQRVLGLVPFLARIRCRFKLIGTCTGYQYGLGCTSSAPMLCSPM